MDENTIAHSDSDLLKRLGVKTEGDAIRLKLMCSDGYDRIEMKKKELKEIILNGTSSAKKPKLTKTNLLTQRVKDEKFM